MSIQNATNQKLHRRLFRFLKFNLIVEFFQIKCAIIYRVISSRNTSVKVFFPYINYYSHPDIVGKFYGSAAPLKWANHSDANIYHCLQSVDERYMSEDISYLIEPNDHILTIGNGLGIRTPKDQIKSLDRINNFLEKGNVKLILVGNDDLFRQASYYFNSEVIKKVRTYTQYRCRPKLLSEDFIEKRLLRSNYNVTRFLCIASDFNIKAVEILIHSFLSHSKKGHLTLVCHNLPSVWRKIVNSALNIELIDKVPLPKILKSKIYKQSDVYINLTHVDSWGAPIEALEYGLPIITCEYHRGNGFVSNNNGFSISFPYNYYEIGRYGVEWNGFNEYMSIVNEAQKKGVYEKTIEELGRKIVFYENNHEVIRDHSVNSINHALNNCIWRSNIELVQIYASIKI